MANRVTAKGQVTIPKRVRDRLKIRPGSEVEFELASDGRVVLVTARRKARGQPSPFARLRGTAPRGMTTDQIMALTRRDT